MTIYQLSSKWTDSHQSLRIFSLSQTDPRGFVNFDVSNSPISLKKNGDSASGSAALCLSGIPISLYLHSQCRDGVHLHQFTYRHKWKAHCSCGPTKLLHKCSDRHASRRSWAVGFPNHFVYTGLPWTGISNQSVRVAATADSHSLFHFPTNSYPSSQLMSHGSMRLNVCCIEEYGSAGI